MTGRINEMADIFLQAGRVIQASQQMESAIKLTLTLLDVQVDSDEKFNETYVIFSRKTLGRLTQSIRSKIDFESKDVLSLENAIDERNYVMHAFFNENATNFLSSEGRSTAYLRLAKAKSEIDSGYKILDAITCKQLAKSGLDIEEATRISGENSTIHNIPLSTMLNGSIT